MMFGEELEAQSRQRYAIGAPVFIADELVAHDLASRYAADFADGVHAGEVIGLGGLGRQRPGAVHARLRPPPARLSAGRCTSLVRDVSGATLPTAISAAVAFSARRAAWKRA